MVFRPHRTVAVLGADFAAGMEVLGHLARLVELDLVGVAALVRVPVVVTVRPGEFWRKMRS